MKLVTMLLLDATAFFGVGLNWSYYRTSFLFSGYGPYYSAVLAAAFMTLEVVLWMKKKSPWYLWILKIGILLYSVSVTLGAQYESTSNMESNMAEVVFEKTDVSGDVEYYREQISKQDERIDSIFRAREEDLIYTHTNDSLIAAEAKKSEYEAELKKLEVKEEAAVLEINSPRTIYSWYAYDLPKIFTDGMSEDFVRVLFQLFSSILLAIMAPVAISILKSKDDDTEELGTVLTADVPEAIELKFPKYEKPVENKIKTSDKKAILKMILYKYPDDGFMHPEDAAEYFDNFHSKNKSFKAYSVEECREIYDDLKSKGMEGKDKEEIEKEML